MEAAKGVITAAAEDNAAYHTMMTNDLLSEYVNDFFGLRPLPVRPQKIAWLLKSQLTTLASSLRPLLSTTSPDGHPHPGNSVLCWL